MRTQEQKARTPLHDHAAERLMLAALLDGRLDVDEALEVVPPEANGRLGAPIFADPFHGRVWGAILRARERGLDVSALTALAELAAPEDREAAERLGDGDGLGDYFSAARIVADKWKLRRGVDAMKRGHAAMLESADADEALANLAAEIIAISDSGGSAVGPMPILKVHEETLRELDEAIELRGAGNIGLGFGIPSIDNAMPISRGHLVIIAGGTSSGKSVLMYQCGLHSARRARAKTLIFSAEMTRAEYLQRIWSSITSIPIYRMRKGDVSDSERNNLAFAASEITGLRLEIDDRPAPTVQQIASRAKAWAMRNGGVDLVVVDYLQRLRATNPKDTEEQRTAEKARELKTLAQQLKCAVVTGSQVNEKDARSRKDKRPMLEDMKYAGAIGEEADEVIGIYRKNRDTDDAEIAILKQRNGAVMEYSPITFNRKRIRFEG